jgi:hypothetical protein
VEWYTATKDELAHIKPLAKFLAFKSIVFLTWWQGVIIAIMYSLGLVRSPLAQSLELKTSIQDFIICIEVPHLFKLDRLSKLFLFTDHISCLPTTQMGIASVVHLYVFPAKPYELLGKQYSPTNISVLGDYAASDPVDPDEVKDISRPTKVRLPQLEPDEIVATNIKESVRDFVIGSGEYVSFYMQITLSLLYVLFKFHEANWDLFRMSPFPFIFDVSCIFPPR